MPNLKSKLSLAGKSTGETSDASSLSLKDKHASSSKALRKSNLGPKITATSQTSRFHVDTLTTLSQEVSIYHKMNFYLISAFQIDLHQVNISVGLNDLLVDSHLRLKAGVHYAVSF